jgi:hypothetical protein
MDLFQDDSHYFCALIPELFSLVHDMCGVGVAASRHDEQ